MRRIVYFERIFFNLDCSNLQPSDLTTLVDAAKTVANEVKRMDHDNIIEDLHQLGRAMLVHNRSSKNGFFAITCNIHEYKILHYMSKLSVTEKKEILDMARKLVDQYKKEDPQV